MVLIKLYPPTCLKGTGTIGLRYIDCLNVFRSVKMNRNEGFVSSYKIKFLIENF